ncbi:MAG: DUF1800 domain-containing protein [Desulfobacterales bacterium]|nr:DUF1800 domain-containing protein [Desulfobacterales bacterium]
MENLSRVSRFLMQATLGADEGLIRQVAGTGIRPWLERELETPLEKGDGFTDETRSIWLYFRQKLVSAHGEAAINGEGNNPALPYKWYFHMTWWHRSLSARTGLLRHRVALALSELLVISDRSVLELDAVGLASYYDLLYEHAFGSYADLLYRVSMHPCMGVYLSHMNNRKADPVSRTHPDENYAREIMQLFTLGLYRLNPDGIRLKDRAGRPVPAYDNRDIKALARVFTGLTASSYEYEWITGFWRPDYNGHPVSFTDGIEKKYKTVPFVNMTRPMAVDERFHDRGPKRLLNGAVNLPGKQAGKEEIRSAVAQLVRHPNTAPFVSGHLIRQLVTSNPSPDYVKAVALAFGPRGDLKAAVRAVLTYPLDHPGAWRDKRNTSPSLKLKSPLLRTVHLLRAFRSGNRSGRYWLIGDDIESFTGQHPLSSPTVFNFYKPDFTPQGPVADAGLVAPEFELHTSDTAINYVNMVYYWVFGGYLPAVSTKIGAGPEGKNAPELDPERLRRNRDDRLRFDLSRETALARDPAGQDRLIREISVVLTGSEDPGCIPDIKAAFESYRDRPEWVVQTIIFLIAVSAEFAVPEV